MFLYGAGIPNLSRQIGMSEHDMAACVSKFKASLPDLETLLDRVQEAGRNFGYLVAVDGRWGRIRSRDGELALNTALNVLLQMTGSLVMKWAHTFAEDSCLEDGIIDSIDAFPIVAHQHDEGQMEVSADEVHTMQTEIHKDYWKEEEKRQHVDEKGIWSAPYIVDRPANSGDDFLVVGRMFHYIGDRYCKAIKKAGEFLKLRCPTDGEYKIGDSWRDTH